MGSVSKDRLLRDVRVVISENEYLEPLIAEGDQMALERDTLLETLVTVAIDKVHSMAPLEMLSDVTNKAEGLEWKVTESGSKIAELPEDFMRLTYVRAREWKKGVLEFVNEESATYMRFSSAQAGVRPTIYNPAAAMVKSSFAGEDGKLGNYIEVCPGGADILVSYIPKCEENTDGEGGAGDGQDAGNGAGLIVADECYWCVVYTIANLYFVSVNDNARAEMMAKEAADVIMRYTAKVKEK